MFVLTFGKNEKNPGDMGDITLAQFVANHYMSNKGKYIKRNIPKIIRYRNYRVAYKSTITVDKLFYSTFLLDMKTMIFLQKIFEKTLQICRENVEDQNQEGLVILAEVIFE